MSRQSLSLVLAERPRDRIVPGQTFQPRTEPAPTEADLQDGDILVETLYLSIDPAMRGWLNDTRSYLPPVQIGEPMRGMALVRTLASRAPHVRPGDLVIARTGWREIAVAPAGQFQPAEQLLAVAGAQGEGGSSGAGVRPTDLLGVLGTTGLTAYFGLTRIGQPKAGETVVVSGAAGATGSVVGQIAKHVYGARVVGIAGGADKTRWIKEELGFDEALDYRDPEFSQKFRDATPHYIDVYWDNVGGDILDAALARANKNARFVICGMISQYNSADPRGPKNFSTVITQRIRMEGFIVLDYEKEYPEAWKNLGRWMAEGKLKRTETIVRGGLQAAEHALVDIFSGKNTGKMLVEVKKLEPVAKV